VGAEPGNDTVDVFDGKQEAVHGASLDLRLALQRQTKFVKESDGLRRRGFLPQFVDLNLHLSHALHLDVESFVDILDVAVDFGGQGLIAWRRRVRLACVAGLTSRAGRTDDPLRPQCSPVASRPAWARQATRTSWSTRSCGSARSGRTALSPIVLGHRRRSIPSRSQPRAQRCDFRGAFNRSSAAFLAVNRMCE